MEAATSIFRQDGPYFANDFIDTLVEAFGVPRKLRKLLRSKTLCKDSIVFWGVNFCREGLWEKGRGEWHEIKQIRKLPPRALGPPSSLFLRVLIKKKNKEIAPESSGSSLLP